jgi:hypothetical protein
LRVTGGRMRLTGGQQGASGRHLRAAILAVETASNGRLPCHPQDPDRPRRRRAVGIPRTHCVELSRRRDPRARAPLFLTRAGDTRPIPILAPMLPSILMPRWQCGLGWALSRGSRAFHDLPASLTTILLVYSRGSHVRLRISLFRGARELPFSSEQTAGARFSAAVNFGFHTK